MRDNHFVFYTINGAGLLIGGLVGVIVGYPLIGCFVGWVCGIIAAKKIVFG